MAVALSVGLCCAQGTFAQVNSPSRDAPSAAPVQSPDLANVHSELRRMSRLLEHQQKLIDRQSGQIEFLERRSNDESSVSADSTPPSPVPPPSVNRIPSCESDRIRETSPHQEAPQGPQQSGIDPLVSQERQLWSLGGQYRVMFNASNYDFHQMQISDDQKGGTFFNQRFRTWVSITPNDCVEGYLQVEMGHIGWGDNFDFPKTYIGPRFPPGDDRVGIETRYGYLGYQEDGLGRMRLGIQPWQDPFGQTLASSDWDFSVGGFTWARTFPGLGDMTLLFGAFSLFEGNVKDSDDAALFTWDVDWKTSENRGLGFSAYFLPDNGEYSYPTAAPYDRAWDLWLGVRASTEIASLPVNGFVIYNTGRRDELARAHEFTHDGVALKLETGPMEIGQGKVRFQTLYSTGDRNPNDSHSREFRTIAQSTRDNFGAQGYWSYLVLTSPHGPSDVNDLGVSLQNRGLGLFTAQAKYDYPIIGRLSGSAAAGWLTADAINPVSGARELGTEMAKVFTFDFGGGLVADFGAAVLFTGDFYRTAPSAPRPNDLWEAFTRVQLEF